MYQQLPFLSGYALQLYLPAELGIIKAKENHYKYWYIDGSLATEEASNWTEERINTLKKLIEKNDVKPIFHGNFKAPLASDIEFLRKSAVAYTKLEIDLAAQLNAPVILHGGAIVEPRLVASVKARALNNYCLSLQELKDYADARCVELYLENLSNYKYYKPFHYIFTTEEEMSYVLERINLKLFLDIGHANVGNGNPIKLIKKFHTSIVGMSFSNNDGETDQHLGINSGEINYRNILSLIAELKWKGIIGFETRDKTPNESVYELEALYNSLAAQEAN